MKRLAGVLFTFILVMISIGCVGADGTVAPNETVEAEEPLPNVTEEEVEQPPAEEEAKCIDSDDGKNILELGVTFKGEEYETDQCSGEDVMEYYCKDNEVLSEIIPCPAKHECSGGVCVESEEPPENVSEGCTDSDAGLNYWSQGTTKKGQVTKEDTCDGDELTEYYCEDDEIKSVSGSCGPGKDCKDGACVDEEKLEIVQGFEILECKDSDGGKNYSVKGNVTYAGNVSSDECVGGKLNEYYCTPQGMPASEEVACGIGRVCSDGICKIEIVFKQECSDSDGGDMKYIKGTASKGLVSSEDYCFFDTLHEFYCEDNSIKEKEYLCDCSAGKCIP